MSGSLLLGVCDSSQLCLHRIGETRSVSKNQQVLTDIFVFCVQYYDSVHLASDQKDLLISQLKAEIFEIEQRDKDYLALRDQLYTIQTKYRHLQDEKLLQDNDFKTRHDSNLMTLQSLKKEIDDTRFLLNEKNRSNNDL